MVRILRNSAVCLLLAILSSGCSDSPTNNGGGGGDPLPNQAFIRILDDGYHEDDVQIAQGGTVSWRSISAVAHTVTPVGHDAWEATEINANDGVGLVVIFPEAGAYPYVCQFHDEERGLVSVIPQ